MFDSDSDENVRIRYLEYFVLKKKRENNQEGWKIGRKRENEIEINWLVLTSYVYVNVYY